MATLYKAPSFKWKNYITGSSNVAKNWSIDDLYGNSIPTYITSNSSDSTVTSKDLTSVTNVKDLSQFYYKAATASTLSNINGFLYRKFHNTGVNWHAGMDQTTGSVTIDIDPTTLNERWYTVGTGGVTNSHWRPMFAGETEIIDSRAARMRLRMSSAVHVRGSVPRAETPEEALAQEALREVVTEEEFRKYLRYGFVLVEGRSGARYQVFRNRHHVKVWVGGKLVEEICVYLKSVGGATAPPTDKVVAFKAMIEADEEAFKDMGNRYRNLAEAA